MYLAFNKRSEDSMIKKNTINNFFLFSESLNFLNKHNWASSWYFAQIGGFANTLKSIVWEVTNCSKSVIGIILQSDLNA